MPGKLHIIRQMLMKKIIIITIILFQCQFLFAQFDTVAFERQAIKCFVDYQEKTYKYGCNKCGKKSQKIDTLIFYDSLYVEKNIPIYSLKENIKNDSLFHYIDFIPNPENQAFILKKGNHRYYGYLVKGIESYRERYNKEIWFVNQDLPSKLCKQDVFITEKLNLFGISSYEKLLQSTETHSIFFIYDIQGFWFFDNKELIHVTENNGEFIYTNGQIEFEQYLLEKGEDCFQLLINGYSNCGKEEVIFGNPDYKSDISAMLNQYKKDSSTVVILDGFVLSEKECTEILNITNPIAAYKIKREDENKFFIKSKILFLINGNYIKRFHRNKVLSALNNDSICVFKVYTIKEAQEAFNVKTKYGLLEIVECNQDEQ